MNMESNDKNPLNNLDSLKETTMNQQLPNNQNANQQENKPMDFQDVPTNDWGLPLAIDGSLLPVE